MENKKILYTAFKPTGRLTLGNFVGMVQNINQYEKDYSTILCVADLHALTINMPREQLLDNSLSCFAFYLAFGFNPDKIMLYLQSQVPQHTELAWVLNNFTMYGEATRMTQFKDYQAKNKSNLNMGILDYPVLMAADILLYNSQIVPVGQDQKQHVELARDIAIRFNSLYGNTFIIPEPKIAKSGAKIMGLLEPAKKMSKSEHGDTGTIFLEDSNEDIIKKVKRAVTDSDGVIKYDVVNKPGVSNLLTIYSALSGQTMAETEAYFAGKNYGTLKTEVAEKVIEVIGPVRDKYMAIRKDEAKLKEIMKKGALRARELAENKMKEVYVKLGLAERI